MVPVVSGQCVLSVEGLVPNQKYVFAVAAYNSQGKLLGNTIGTTTLPLLASMPVPILSTWAHFAQVAFQTEQYALAKRACRELWSHYTIPGTESHSTQDGLATTRLHKETLQSSSAHLCQLFLTSIFIETDINIQQGSMFCDSFSGNGPFIWEQEARLAECERMLVAMDLAMYLNNGIAAVQAVVSCYGLLAPLIFHQILCNPAIEVLKKCLIVLEENAGLLKQKWTGNVSESFMHMIACIAYYLSKTLGALREHEMAFTVMECSRRLLQEVFDAQQHIKRHANEAVGVGRSAKSVQSKMDHSARDKGEVKISLQLKALHVKNKKKITHGAALTTDSEISRPLTGSEDPTMLYELISSSTLNEACQYVMKVRRNAHFAEYAAVLLQRTMEEGHPDLVLKWGQSIFEFLSRRDKVMGLSTKCLEGNGDRKRRNGVQTPRGNEPPQDKNTPSHDDTRKKIKQNIPHSILQKVKNNREMHIVENLITMLSSLAQRRKKLLHLRNICCEERVWRSQLNYILAQAHLTLFYESLDQMHGGALQHRYSQLNPLCFSLAYSGVLVRRNSQQPKPSKDEGVSEKDSSHSGLRNFMTTHNNRNKKEAVRNDDSASDESGEEEEDPPQPVEQKIETQRRAAALLLDSLNKAASHLRRVMVLAHRGSHWTTLQYVCQTVWDQSCRTAFIVQTGEAQFEPHSPIIAEQLSTTFTQLLVLATDLIMDMLNRLGLWRLYDRDLTEEELESSLHFSAPLDDGTQVDLRWVRSLVLHTLERLHDSGKWETLAHFALLFNSYTRERYTLITTPLLIHAQRRLLERISSFGGPAVPQPHHIKTQKATGREVTYRSYAGCQLLSGWTPHQVKRLSIHKKAALANSNPQHAVELKGAEKQRSMCLVCVPLDVEDTLACYQQALERRPYCLHVLQHSRSLLFLHLAYTQPCFAAQPRHCQSRSLHSASLVDFSHTVVPTPNIQPYDLAEEDFTSPDALYGLPISSDHMKTVTAAHSTSIKYLQANNHDSLRVLALHDLGNLHFYNGNTRAAHSYWSKAVDCALHSPGSAEKWDGISFGSVSLQDALKQSGVWGCLQAAGLTAKIAQHILASDISQRTKYCLFSAYLFKCVLCCSLAQPQVDLQYASHNIGDELLPGVALFSEPHRVHLDTTVTSLHFVCHWLYATGYYITIQPMLALYLHFVGTVCRDVQRTVEGKMLKIRALTELCLFTEAARETVQLTQGIGVLLPNGHYIARDEQPVKTFYSNKSLLDNVEALEELVNCDIAPEVQKLYGSTLCLRLNLTRVQLVLALSNSIHGAPVSDTVEDESCSGSSKHHEQDTSDSESSCLKVEEPKLLDLHIENLTLERIKFLLLKGASSLVDSVSQQLTSLCCSKTENLELTIESNLIKANLYLQQGHTALSSEMAVSSLVLLQTSPVRTKGLPGSQKPESELPHPRTGSEWVEYLYAY
ncbi:hypothetical protein INR49_027830 [Caranx melampygus]|nr:hypothetical protein INR49_027830 [Caranx melampygus]